MHRAGVSIQSHGMTHRSLRSISEEAMVAELEGSRQLIKQEIGEAPVAFAYPRGVYNSRCMEAVREAGYSFACTVERGCNNPENLEMFALKRTAVKGYRWIHDWQFKRGAARGCLDE